MDIYDLTNDCMNEEDYLLDGGKIYLPPVYDSGSGHLHLFQGYGD